MIPVIMKATLTVTGQLTDDGDVDLMVDFSNSLDWVSITNVTDDAGVPVASFTALSSDGSDWAARRTPSRAKAAGSGTGAARRAARSPTPPWARAPSA